ncbi:MAG: HPr(Ser) kinase/phosphatase [Gammaproteobacteria bacterium]|nr:HPr(Ser) kinase/phosphatase [Gammaproteobacteria bacterium]NNJ49964.1 HPr(Ser) kinase/phosphatase [Gammaproteobacteria bacterium]
MKEILSAESIIVNLASRIELKWVAGAEDPDKPLHELDVNEHATLIGHLNLIHNNIIQVIGKTECEYLHGLEDDFRRSTLTQLFTNNTVAIILSDGLPVPELLCEFANKYCVPVLSCKAESNDVVDAARYYLNKLFTNKEILHGVFMEVHGTGVLITGESSVGKSELALDLISRGHRLVADDAPEFTRIGPDILDGRSPAILQGFMEVRGLGVLNIREMYGDNAIKRNKYLRLIVHMEKMNDDNLGTFNRLTGQTEVQRILDVEIPVTIVPVAPGRNLSVIVEAAVRNHILRKNGYDASQQLIDRQQQAIDNNS